jgi:hypothetical protein
MTDTHAGPPERPQRPVRGFVTRIGTLIFGQTQSPEQSAANQGWILVLIGTTVAGIVLIALIATSTRAFAAGCLLALAAAMVGSIVGFLFGLPRSSRTDVVAPRDPNAPAGDAQRISVESRSSGYRANTNLEDISDWLTKILVGVGLTQLTSIPSGFKALVDVVKVAMGAGDDSAAIAGSLLVGYLIIGFLGTYLWARTRLGQALRLADVDPTERLNAMEETVSNLRASVEANQPGTTGRP